MSAIQQVRRLHAGEHTSQDAASGHIWHMCGTCRVDWPCPTYAATETEYDEDRAHAAYLAYVDLQKAAAGGEYVLASYATDMLVVDTILGAADEHDAQVEARNG